MKFKELAIMRRSVRNYKSDPVPEALLRQVLEAGTLAPTAKNGQPFHFVVVRDAGRLDQLAQAYPVPFLREVPVIIVVCTEPGAGWTRDRHDGKNYCEVDTAIAADHMTLAATDLGLGTCWIAAFDPLRVSEVLKLPAGIDPLILLPLGYPNDDPHEKSRKTLEELVRYEQW